MTTARRSLLKGGAALGAMIAAPTWLHAQTTAPAERRFAPEAGTWRTFEVTTRVEIADPQGATRVWLPVPSMDTAWQQSLDTRFSSNGTARMGSDLVEGARFVSAEFAAGVRPVIEVTSRVKTQNRAAELTAGRVFVAESADTLRHYTRPTRLLPTDGIVRTTAMAATKGAKTDEQKARAIYDWVVTNAFRDPKTRGCGEGDIKTMLETGNLGGKCADLNAIFVGLCRAAGLPARDVYGIRLAPSAFGYKELSGNPASLKGAQHCRAEVHLTGFGWVAMDPANALRDEVLDNPAASIMDGLGTPRRPTEATARLRRALDDVDVLVHSTVRALTEIWTGDSAPDKEIRAGDLKVQGAGRNGQRLWQWLGRSMFAPTRMARGNPQ